ncbi:hypothetical protein [Leisingera caerulea]|uniref:DUF3899 domain-containing protein n=1 Tax=Leisingera caerulea TaxID=506591 RepID=A0A9Q9HLC7_LEICA|nr:hypothetical protein [Leisingera caerulea]UWQ50179.1 hypothetical protein K3720_01870 [Leisingera caerulea]UWQ54267.1 hypothetical protein K3721_01645 [Leisingera caerulea]UWQ63024.1 hypothetical protein K3723_01600 [Leisingera caerulea]UWQ83914.1 hypothetical protein K3726_01550 [Leisingera caerulea]
MFGFIRLLLILMVVLTVAYGAVSLYSREVRRAKLKRRWKDKGLTGDRAAFIQRGLRQYDRSFRRKLILLVYIVPLGAIALLVYVINFM